MRSYVKKHSDESINVFRMPLPNSQITTVVILHQPRFYPGLLSFALYIYNAEINKQNKEIEQKQLTLL